MSVIINAPGNSLGGRYIKGRGSSAIARSINGARGDISKYSYSQTIKAIDFKRN